MIEERRLDAPRRSHLLQYALNITSQGGEDGVIAKIFEYLNNDDTAINTEATSSAKSSETISGLKYCVDIGAWDGKHLSNTYLLITSAGWGGLLFEADMKRHEQMQSLYYNRSDVR